MRTLSLALSLACSSLVLGACGEEDPAVSPSDDADGDDGEDGKTEDEGDDAPGGKLDAGRLDARVTEPDTSKPDAATKPDAAVKPDGGGPVGGGGGGAGLKPKCVKKDSQVMIVGDSYINWVTHTFPQDIIDVSKQNWRMEAVGAYSMGSGGIGFIPDLYRESMKKDPDCHTILMDGGGNDLLVADSSKDAWGDCKTDKAPTLKNCQDIITTAIAAADKMLMEASAAGIRDVVYFFYPHVPNGTLLGGPNPNAMLDFALPQVKDFCDGVEEKTKGKTRCTFIDMVPVFEGHE
ncbi:MAG: hypothetical protein ABW352_22945, partial [Polyangiales bacterium]